MHYDWGRAVAVAGLIGGLVIVGTMRLGLNGWLPKLGFGLLLPGLVSVIWRLAQYFGWWVILIAIVSAFLTGSILTRLTMSSQTGTDIALRLQPISAALFIGGAVACWFV